MSFDLFLRLPFLQLALRRFKGKPPAPILTCVERAKAFYKNKIKRKMCVSICAVFERWSKTESQEFGHPPPRRVRKVLTMRADIWVCLCFRLEPSNSSCPMGFHLNQPQKRYLNKMQTHVCNFGDLTYQGFLTHGEVSFEL